MAMYIHEYVLSSLQGMQDMTLGGLGWYYCAVFRLGFSPPSQERGRRRRFPERGLNKQLQRTLP